MEKQTIEASVAAFEKANPGVKVDLQHIPTDYTTKITTMIAGGVGPDVFYLDTALIHDWGIEGKLANIFDYVKEDPELTVEDFMDLAWVYWAPGKSGGTLPAIEPFGIFYNKDMFTKAGVPFPPATAEKAWTWDQYLDAARKLTFDAKGKHPNEAGFDPENIVQYGTQYGAGYIPAVYSNGGRYITEDGTKTALTSPEALDAIQKIADLMNLHHVAPTPTQSGNIPEISTALMTERVAMVVAGQWVCLDLGVNTELNWDVGVLPKLKNTINVIQGGTIAISETTKNKAEAWKLYKWFNNAETVLPLHSSGLWMPSMKKWYTDETFIAKWASGNPAHPANFRTAILDTTLKNGMPAPNLNVKNTNEMDSLINAALDQVWLGEKSAAQALGEIEGQLNSLVKGYYDPSRKY